MSGPGGPAGQGPTVVLADDHVPLRRRIRAALEADGWDVLGEAGDADEAIELAEQLSPDVVLLDISMPGNGIRAAQHLARSVPDSAVVMLTHSSDDDDLLDSLRAGAAGYLLKDTAPDRLGPALRGALAGEAAMSPRLVTRILDELRAPTKGRFRRGAPAARRLSARESDVMALLAEGLTTDEVAARLFVSPTTVRVHVSAAVRKLRATDRDDALRMLTED